LEDEVILLEGFDRPQTGIPSLFGNSVLNSSWQQRLGFNSLPRAVQESISGQRVSSTESRLINEADVTFRGNNPLSNEISLRAVSQDDFNRLLDLNLFQGGSLENVTNTGIEDSVFRINRRTNRRARLSGDALSSLDEAGLEELASVVEARQGQILNSSVTTGLARQSFSLLSGN